MHNIYLGITRVLGHYSYLHKLSKCNKYEDDFNNGVSIILFTNKVWTL